MEEVQKELEENPAEKIEVENKRLEEALKKKEELLAKSNELSARDRLAGKSEAGKPIKTQEDLNKEKAEADADRIYNAVYTKKKK